MAVQTLAQPAVRSRWRAALLSVVVAFLALHFVHLRADLPNGSAWRDAARFTDEGWYSDAAIRHTLFGAWRVDGDLNTAAVMPVWPLMELLPFAVFGVHVEVARALAGLCFAGACAVCLLMLREVEPPGSLAPEVAVLLMAVSAFGFVFGRLAALETPMLLFTLLALWMAGRAGRSWGAAFALGILLPVTLLAKTSSVAVFPAIAWRLGSGLLAEPRSEGLWGRRLLTLGCVAVPAAVVLGVYLSVVAREGLRVDIQTYFAALHDRVNRHNFVRFALELLSDLRWMGRAIAPLGAVGIIASLRLVRRDPLLQSLLLWIGGYLVFILYHGNFQPRYLLMVLAPVCMVAARELARLLSRQGWPAIAAVAVLVVAVAVEGLQSIGWALHPRYTYSDAAAEIRRIVDADPGHPRTLEGSSAAEIGLMSGLPHLSGELTTDTTAYLAQRYGAGWYCLWEGERITRGETDAFAALQSYFRTQEVRRFRIMDDPERSTLVLYRLEPLSGAPAPPVIRPELRAALGR